MRGPEASHRMAEPSEEPAASPAISGDELPGLVVLARLPEVSNSRNPARLSQQLNWLKKLDLKQIRQLNLDPNWVAGGVLALVLLLLLVITMNRSPKPAANTAAESDAPSWNAGATNTAPTTLTATPNGAAPSSPNFVPGAVIPGSVAGGAPPTSAIAGAGQIQPVIQNQASNSSQPVAASQPAASTQGQFSLEGVFYPRTNYPAPVAHSLGQAVNQPAASSFGQEVRTAQRDVRAPHYAPAHPTSAQPDRAQLQGIISQP
jgi:hypothetical protein